MHGRDGWHMLEYMGREYVRHNVWWCLSESLAGAISESVPAGILGVHLHVDQESVEYQRLKNAFAAHSEDDVQVWELEQYAGLTQYGLDPNMTVHPGELVLDPPSAYMFDAVTACVANADNNIKCYKRHPRHAAVVINNSMNKVMIHSTKRHTKIEL